ncbi:MAG TPA: 23S rRNA (guanosine(2251)-2'-O)-methyltransferase RlmB [Acidimicrobiales bacterium]|nr:23S rRNA (guanosine(2251)-2'-O)-methyltransferase RlmB [Acidimicrobiales bacterium]
MEGRQAVLELLRAGSRPVRELWVADGLDPSPQLDEIERLAVRHKVRTLLVPRKRFDATARTEAPQGVLARAKALDEADLDELAEGDGRGPAFLLVLDGITDPHNFGALLRTAEVAGVTGVVVGRHRAAHVTPTVAKVAAGAIEHVPIAVVPGIPAALARLNERDVTTVGLDANAGRSLYELGPEVTRPVALVLGAEGKGLAALSRKRCSVLAAIPRRGRLDSLNVATAGAVACFEIARRRS